MNVSDKSEQAYIISQQNSQRAIAEYSDFDADDPPWQNRENGCPVEKISDRRR